MAASMVPTILITRKPYLFFRKPNPRRSPICSRSKNSVIIASSSSSSSFRSSPETECPVPQHNEYTALSTSFPFSWAAADLRDYCTRLTLVGSSFAILAGLPVAAFGTGAVANTSADAFRCGVGAASAGIISVTFAVLQMYLGWTYVGNRLLSATVEYEETGWYDGQIWVKTPEVLARDRLLGSFFAVVFGLPVNSPMTVIFSTPLLANSSLGSSLGMGALLRLTSFMGLVAIIPGGVSPLGSLQAEHNILTWFYCRRMGRRASRC